MKPSLVGAVTGFLAGLLLLSVPPFTSDLQADITGKITGVVTDAATGEPLPGAAIQLVEIGRGSFTNEQGRYFLLNVPLGTYSLRVTLIGFRTQVIEDVQVTLDDVSVVDVQLETEVLEVGEETIVTAARPLVDTRQAGSLQTTERELILDLPVRDIEDILLFQQGIIRINSFTRTQPFAEVRGLTDFRIRGGRNAEAIFLVDNLPIHNPVFGGVGTPFSTRSIGQLDFLTGGYPGQYGNALSGVINIVTPEGGERYEGELQFGSSRVAGVLGSEPNRLARRDQVDAFAGGYLPGLRDQFRWLVAASRVTGADKVWEFDDAVDDPLCGGAIGGPGRLPDCTAAVEARDPSGLLPRTGDLIPGWRGIGNRDAQDIFGKGTWIFSPGMKLHGTIQWANQDIFAFFDQPLVQVNIDRSQFNRPDTTVFSVPVGTDIVPPTTKRSTNRQSFFWSHTLGGGRSFYTVTGQRFKQRRLTFTETPFGNRISPDLFANRAGNALTTLILIGEFNGDNSFTTWAVQGQGTNQVTDHHELKGGFNYYLYDIDFFEVQDIGLNDVLLDTVAFGVSLFVKSGETLPDGTVVEEVVRVCPDGTTFSSSDTAGLCKDGSRGVGGAFVEEEAKPFEIAGYLQDTIEYDFMTVNLGLRFDAGETGGSFWVNPFDPYNRPSLCTEAGRSLTVAELQECNAFAEDTSDDFEDAEARIQFSPRIAISFPVTATSNVFLNFGRYSQNPLYRNVFTNNGVATPFEGTPKSISLETREGQAPVIGNALLDLQLSNQFEIGFNAAVSDDWAVGATIWSKDNSGLTGVETIPFFDSQVLYGGGLRTFQVLVNRDFSSSRGVDLRLRKRLSNYWRLLANYTLSRARTNSSEPFTQIQNVDNGDPPDPRRERADDGDTPHNFQLVLDTIFPEGTFTGAPAILNNFRVGLQFFASSGLPFTPIRDVFGVVQEEINSGRIPASYTVSLRAVKGFRHGNLDWNVFADVRNLFDRKNAIEVFPSTGRPDRGIFDRGRENEAGGVENIGSSQLDRPWHFGPRREVLLGFRVRF